MLCARASVPGSLGLVSGVPHRHASHAVEASTRLPAPVRGSRATGRTGANVHLYWLRFLPPFADLRGPFLLGMYSITGADASLCGLPGPLSGSAPMCAPFAYAFCPRPSLYLTRFGRRVLAASASTPSWPLRFALASVACLPVSHPRFAPTHSAVLASI